MAQLVSNLVGDARAPVLCVAQGCSPLTGNMAAVRVCVIVGDGVHDR